MEDVPAHFLCPITQETMEYPYITAVGNSYEHHAIAKWLNEKATDPLTGTVLQDKVILPNNSLRSEILEWFESNPLAAQFRNSDAPKPPPANVARASDGSLAKILTYKGQRTIGGGKKARDSRLEVPKPFTKCGHYYTFALAPSGDGVLVSCDGGPGVEMLDANMFVTPGGVVFYDGAEVRDTKVLPSTLGGTVEPCQYAALCTRHDCPLAHPCVCRWGTECKSIVGGSKNQCKYGGLCFVKGCRLDHPTGRQLPGAAEVLCTFGVRCTNKKCTFAHPEGRDKFDRPALCHFGSNCTNKSCTFAHPSGRSAFPDVPRAVCKFGAACTRMDCAYEHPEGRAVPGVADTGCKFLHPAMESVVPLGREWPANQSCKYGTACGNRNCRFAHPIGRMTVAREPARVFITHSVTLQPLYEPVPLALEIPPSATCFQFQGEFVLFFEPYVGTWAKDHYKNVTVYRFDQSLGKHAPLGVYSLAGHYCNCAVAADKYMVFSFWPYEEEAIRTIWESLKVTRAMEKELKGKGKEIEGFKKQIDDLEQELRTAKDKNAKLKEVIAEKDQYIDHLKAQIQALRSRVSSLQHQVYHQSRAAAQARQEAWDAKKAQRHAERAVRVERAVAREEKRKTEASYQRLRQNQERSRLERLRLRDPIHIYALQGGEDGAQSEHWKLVVDYHKGAHAISLAHADSEGKQSLELTEHETVYGFDLVVPSNIASIGTRLPVVPSSLCPDF